MMITIFRELIATPLKKVVLKHNVRVDECIAKEIVELNNKHNIQTKYSCCGHGEYGDDGSEFGYIMVAIDDVKKMIRLGYKPSTLQSVDIITSIYNDERFSYYGRDATCWDRPFHFFGPTSFIPKSVCHCKKKVKKHG